MTQNPDSKSHSYPPRDAVEKRAREIWEQRGRPDGQELDHWYQAESELLEMRNKVEKIDPAIKPAPSGNPAPVAAKPAPAASSAPKAAPPAPKPAAAGSPPAGSAAKPVTPVPKPSGSNQPVAPSPKPPLPPKKK